MKNITKIVFTAILINFVVVAKAQIITFDYLTAKEKKEVAEYKVLKNDTSVFYFSFDFASQEIKNKQLFDKISSADIDKIDFIYTQYKLIDTFNQKKLNRKRFAEFQKHFPKAFDNSFIEWNIIIQTKAKNVDEAKQMFHGFAVHVKKNTAKPDTKAEIAYITKKLKLKDVDTVIKEKKRLVRTAYYRPILRFRQKRNIKCKWSFFNLRKPIYETVVLHDSTFIEHGYVFTSEIEDTVIMTVLNRNKNWSKVVVVQDVTGSMYKYTLQTLAWLKIHSDNTKLKDFVFFNDGDDHPDGPIGKNDGAYYIKSQLADSVMKKSLSTMELGYGGRGPENDLESVLYAIEKYPNCEAVVLIADNYAPVSDMKLLPKITKPVRVIICGASDNIINHQYLEIALSTGGSIHTIEHDILNFIKLRKGEKMKIGNKYYKYIKGHLILVTDI